MKILRVFPKRTSHTPADDMVFIGDPPLDRPPADEVHISCTFTWDKQKAERLQKAWAQYYPVVKLGGPAYDDPGNGFTAGMYVKTGITVTSRGCNNLCPWCLVNPREGSIRELPITIGNIIQDNNILQCSASHIDKVLDMLKTQKEIMFTGGIESKLVTEYITERLRGLRIKAIFMAADTPQAIKPLCRALKMLAMPRDKVRCYVLLQHNPNETISDATERMINVWQAGAIPFAQLYQPPDRHIVYSQEWRQFARTFQRPAATKAYFHNLESIRGKDR